MKETTRYKFHTPVLLSEVIYYLKVETGYWYVDATSGGGGHTEAILQNGGNVLALDQDTGALEYIRGHLNKYLESGQLQLCEGNFRDIDEIVRQKQIQKIKGILFDLGMSTYQLKEAGRGFSFLRSEPLDMRMSLSLKTTAADIINTYSREELYEIFRKFGEEHLGLELADIICRTRRLKKFQLTTDLGDLASNIYKKAGIHEKIHPATRAFQALRIAVNSEIDNLRKAIPKAFEIIDTSGRLIVISFHSLEDRIVKQSFLGLVSQGKASLVTKKPLVVTEAEKKLNPASRSAKLRVIQKN